MPNSSDEIYYERGEYFQSYLFFSRFMYISSIHHVKCFINFNAQTYNPTVKITEIFELPIATYLVHIYIIQNGVVSCCGGKLLSLR